MLQPNSTIVDITYKGEVAHAAFLNQESGQISLNQSLDSKMKKNLIKHESNITLPSLNNREKFTARYDSKLSAKNTGLGVKESLLTSFES